MCCVIGPRKFATGAARNCEISYINRSAHAGRTRTKEPLDEIVEFVQKILAHVAMLFNSVKCLYIYIYI